jgi:hypothetical protein
MVAAANLVEVAALMGDTGISTGWHTLVVDLDLEDWRIGKCVSSGWANGVDNE